MQKQSSKISILVRVILSTEVKGIEPIEQQFHSGECPNCKLQEEKYESLQEKYENLEHDCENWKSRCQEAEYRAAWEQECGEVTSIANLLDHSDQA